MYISKCESMRIILHSRIFVNIWRFWWGCGGVICVYLVITKEIV
jgi:hypothetical protein